MAFTLADIQKPKIGTVVKELNYKDMLNLTMTFDGDTGFATAWENVVSKMNSNKALTKESLSRANNPKDSVLKELAPIHVIGEFLITEWDVVNESGKEVAINGENFAKLCGSIGTDQDNVEFVTWVFEQFTAISKEFGKRNKKVKKIKKKPSKSTSTRKKPAS